MPLKASQPFASSIPSSPVRKILPNSSMSSLLASSIIAVTVSNLSRQSACLPMWHHPRRILLTLRHVQQNGSCSSTRGQSQRGLLLATGAPTMSPSGTRTCCCRTLSAPRPSCSDTSVRKTRLWPVSAGPTPGRPTNPRSHASPRWDTAAGHLGRDLSGLEPQVREM